MAGDRSETISNPPSRQRETRSPKSRMLAFLMALIFGYTGLHRFYVGKFWTGLALFLTGGGFGIWWIVDLILIGTGRFEDDEGRVLGPPRTSDRELPREESSSETPRGTDGDVGGGREGEMFPEDVRVESEGDEEVRLDDEELLGDPLEEEFEQLEQEYGSNSRE